MGHTEGAIHEEHLFVFMRLRTHNAWVAVVAGTERALSFFKLKLTMPTASFLEVKTNYVVAIV